MTMRVVVVRGAALNKWEMQNYEPLRPEVDVVAVGSRDGSYDLDGLRLPVTRLRTLAPSSGRGRMAGRALRRILGRDRGARLLRLERSLAGADVVHAAETFIPFSEQVVEAKARHGWKFVLTCWENIPFLHDDDPAISARKRAVREGTDLFLAVTPLAKRALMLEGVAEERITVIPMGVDQSAFRPQAKDAALLAEWGLAPDARVVLYSGRLLREKGLSDLLLSAGILFRDRELEDVRLVLVGAGPERIRLETMARELGFAGRVVFVAPQPYARMPKVHAAADVFVLPSVPAPYWQEQFGMVLIEAMACGKAIVTTASGSIPDVVSDAALLVPPFAPEALADAIGVLLRDAERRHRLESAARAHGADRYSSTRIAVRLREAYDAVLQQR